MPAKLSSAKSSTDFDVIVMGAGHNALVTAAYAAQAAVGPQSGGHDDQRAWNVESVTVYQRVASA